MAPPGQCRVVLRAGRGCPERAVRGKDLQGRRGWQQRPQGARGANHVDGGGRDGENRYGDAGGRGRTLARHQVVPVPDGGECGEIAAGCGAGGR